jgi:glycosyltransferase involved in cell wall biosynthesis
MRVAFFLEANLKNPGAYNQTLSIVNLIYSSFDKKDDFVFIVNSSDLSNSLKKKKINLVNYNKSIMNKFFDFFFGLSFLFRFLIKFNLEHSFTKFLRKNNVDLVIFLSPSELSLYCGEINFALNIWDLDHKKNSPFPEHRKNYIFEMRENFLEIVLFKAFKIIVPHYQNKKDLIKLYNCDQDKILVQTLVPYLPIISKERIVLSKEEDQSISNLPVNKKIILYPGTFWAHKNHKYIVDCAALLRKENINDFHFVMCGSDRGTFEYIKQSIKENNLSGVITLFSLVSDFFLMKLYEKSFAVIMPTDAGPTNLPLYEAMFFRKPIFYSQNIADDKEIQNIIIPIDIKDPNSFIKKIKNIKNEDIINKIELGVNYYNNYCNQSTIYHLYNNIIIEFEKILNQWKK